MNTNKTDKIVKVSILSSVILASLSPVIAYADESNLKIPELSSSQNGTLMMGLVICLLGMAFGFYQFLRVKKIRAHKSMLDVSAIIFETCKTYLIQQGKFIAILFLLIGSIIAFYFGYLQGTSFGGVLLVLGWTIVGILGSYGVAWYGIRMNTFANSRMAFASLKGKPLNLVNIPLDAGMSIGVLLICVELFMMLVILIFVPRSLAGASFIGFAIGESLGASALRIAGGIFTKIADIGSDLMKIAFKIKEDDPRNPGVIADCTGDNAGDSVGPTADGFETYGVTGVALISFIVLAVGMAFPEADRLILQSTLLTWIFTMRILMVVTSIAAFYINRAYSDMKYSNTDDLDFEQPLTNLIWISSILSIIVIFVVSYLILGPGTQVALTANSNSIWYVLAIIISCGTLGGALIPEVTKIFTSGKSKHVQEVVTASREGGASLNILSGLVAGNFSAFWQGMVFVLLMFVAYIASTLGLKDIMIYPSVFAFGLVAFGLLSMGPVTIAVDSYGPVTDNAQSIYELSLIETIPNISKEIERDFGFKPDFEKAKYYLEANDGAGNTFKATAKPVLIGTAVVGATTMIFSLILVIQDVLKVKPETILNLLNPYTLFGFMCGGAIIYWFTGASTQAVSTGAYRAVEFIKKNIELDEDADQRASTEKSKEVVKICTQYAQKGMFNIFVAIFSFALAFAFFSAPRGNNTEPVAFFVAYLISIAVFGLYQAIFMANAGGCWDNAKKVVEVDLDEKGTPLHDACVIGDTVGDPFKDTSSVALNPIIKFTTLFGMLAMEIAISERFRAVAPYIGAIFFIIAIIFVWRSFYGMRIKN
ncbi:sodium-translocating pyrophosphatase [Clostridium estertheticum]|uniref:K(+)-insensitive pyrophosphate-energized proton pump n=1 Tax=Clostridium estertheticum TaxID=238834 RepID=A0A5N7ILB0_9CLOT|nr:sodium-translocating pyrophosphatase [Clostridium estertheticum]MBU3072680.1 sodium-translocating pyrophosphatase [Clostridium estertheticum]MBU3162773.1 sodium-translocating pyrophosphatase [Clostridium estertheticum]MBU3171990.1 sodium-translocating pyrophosphatase [Clostridium estertheticum]MBU3184986.1 sodium-translocating pyrophosphatase [Clostridium estertheticum]MPQ31100.1 sodium-translocating pyrophosphatase [Clostridium estertheticum]